MTGIAEIKISKPKRSRKLDLDVLVGKDILELVSGAMYVEPLSIYREYIQNAVDAIDEAKEQGLYKGRRQPRIDICIDPVERIVKIRDNGIGVSKKDFIKRLTAFGASQKKGTSARGFRGVGRLSGLGYCQQLIFRTRAKQDAEVSELLWDGRRFKEILLDVKYHGGISDVVHGITEVSSYHDATYPEHFFEVELVNIIRYRKDILLNEEIIENYLTQVAPLPFHPKFKYGVEIQKFLENYQAGKNYPIYLTNINNEYELEPLYRPYRNGFNISNSLKDKFIGVEYFEIPGISGAVAACGWLAEHSYYGAIPKRELIKGIRLRAGNIQVGSDEIVSEVFKEPRFNSWTTGEIHVLSKKVSPNGRRDNFEANAHYMNLQNHLVPQTKNIAKTCRVRSNIRNKIGAFELEKHKVQENRKIIVQSAITKKAEKELKGKIVTSLSIMREIIEMNLFNKQDKRKLMRELYQLESSVDIGKAAKGVCKKLEDLPKNKRASYMEIIDLIYICSPNKGSAQILVDKILSKL